MKDYTFQDINSTGEFLKSEELKLLFRDYFQARYGAYGKVPQVWDYQTNAVSLREIYEYWKCNYQKGLSFSEIERIDKLVNDTIEKINNVYASK
ncbi:hypothetical protein GF376_00810 [Candidatus Peregrinibacteria bacterium]|nr:hypothetical protein [Candidatus Peregrinibacteria bacterium]